MTVSSPSDRFYLSVQLNLVSSDALIVCQATFYAYIQLWTASPYGNQKVHPF